jgi:LPS-assembly lipoprotein
MQRRLILSAGAWVALAGCGFKLRGAPDFAFRSLFVNAGEGSLYGNELKRNLASIAALTLVTDPKDTTTAEAVFDLLAETREKTVVGVNTSGQVREFQLRLRIRFRVRTPQGKVLIGDTELLQQRDISFNESAVLAKEAEEGLIYRDMQSDLVQQTIRRLAAIQAL